MRRITLPGTRWRGAQGAGILGHGLWVGCLGIASTGCQIEQQQPAEAPDVEVDIDPGRWPEYDVDWADVDIGTEERTITVPTLRIEEETQQVTVPFIRVTPPGGRETQERMVSLEMNVPHPGYELDIVEVRASDDDLWVIGELQETATTTAGPARVSDQLVIDAPANLDVRRVVIGQPPGGGSANDVQFVRSRAELTDLIPDEARVLYTRPRPRALSRAPDIEGGTMSRLGRCFPARRADSSDHRPFAMRYGPLSATTWGAAA